MGFKNMLRSMTGFGQAEYKDDKVSLHVEVRSLNNRFLKVTSRVHEVFLSYQERLERPLKEGLSRGTIHLNIEYRPLLEVPGYHLNLETLKSYYRTMQKLREELGPEGDVPLASLFTLPGICERVTGVEGDVEGQVARAEGLVKEALAQLLEMRIQEGKALEVEIMRHKAQIERLLDRLEEKAPEVVTAYKERLRKRVSLLLQDASVELLDSDLAREVAFFAERSDITEEIARLRHHLLQMERAAQQELSAGRRLEFIVQEMFREANTMGSKISDGEMLKDVIDIKIEIEKIKEQSFNVE